MATLTLRPNAAGDDTNWTPNTGDNYAAVDETSNDADTTYVARAGTEVDDLYNVETSDLLTGAVIDGIVVYASAKYVESGTGVISVSPTLKLGLKTAATEYWDTGDTITSSYADYSQAWALNPADSAAWEKADIDALQVGVRSAQTTGTGSKVRVPRVTQEWIVVTYHNAYSLTCDAGSFAETGQDATLTAQRKLTGDYGSFALTGQDVTLTYSGGGAEYDLICDAGSFTHTGQDAGLLAARKLVTDYGSFTHTGQAVTITAARKLVGDYGSFTLTGQDCTITYAGAGGAYTLTCDYASFTHTGQTVTIALARKLSGDYGSFTLTGQSAGVLAARKLVTEYGAYTLTGQSAGVLAGRKFVPEYGAYTLTGQAVTFSITRALAMVYASFALTGQDVTLTYSSTTVPGSIVVGETGNYSTTGVDAGAYTITVTDAAASVYSIVVSDAEAD